MQEATDAPLIMELEVLLVEMSSLMCSVSMTRHYIMLHDNLHFRSSSSQHSCQRYLNPMIEFKLSGPLRNTAVKGAATQRKP